jgi:hypothetical protein
MAKVFFLTAGRDRDRSSDSRDRTPRVTSARLNAGEIAVAREVQTIRQASGDNNGYANANPKALGGTGRRTFCLDTDGVVHQNWSSEPATANGPELQ